MSEIDFEEKVKENIFANTCPLCQNDGLIVEEMSVVGSEGSIICESCETIIERQGRMENRWKVTETKTQHKGVELPQNHWKGICESNKTLEEVDLSEFEESSDYSTQIQVGVLLLIIVVDLLIILSAPFSLVSWFGASLVSFLGFLVINQFTPDKPEIESSESGQSGSNRDTANQRKDRNLCPKCSTKNPSQNNYCFDCGTELSD